MGPSCPSVPAAQKQHVNSPQWPLSQLHSNTQGQLLVSGYLALSPALHRGPRPASKQTGPRAPTTASRASFSCRSGSWRSAASSQSRSSSSTDAPVPGRQGGPSDSSAARRTGPHFSHRQLVVLLPTAPVPQRLSLPLEPRPGPVHWEPGSAREDVDRRRVARGGQSRPGPDSLHGTWQGSEGHSD